MNKPRIVELVEYQSYFLLRENLLEEQANYVFGTYNDKVAVDWPTPKTNYNWKLTAQGWVGYLPVSADFGINLQPKTGIQNLFGMLEYAYDLKSFTLLDGQFDSDSVQDFFERIAKILVQRITDRIRVGLYREYVEEHAILPYIRGRMDVVSLSQDPLKTKISCYSEDQTLDVEENQILAWTMYSILRSGMVQRDETLQLVRKLDRTLRNAVSLHHFQPYDCLYRTYNRLNSDYEVIHKLCRFFLEQSGPTHTTGEHTMIPFIVEMPKLFESFVVRWLQAHIETARYHVRGQVQHLFGEQNELEMRLDILILDAVSSLPLCVIDTKYKVNNTFANADYYQVIAYAEALGCSEALLVYPEELPRPMDVKPGNIRVRSLAFDLNRPIEVAGKEFLGKLYGILDDTITV